MCLGRVKPPRRPLGAGSYSVHQWPPEHWVQLDQRFAQQLAPGHRDTAGPTQPGLFSLLESSTLSWNQPSSSDTFDTLKNLSSTLD